jgi:hypothetical protein
VYLYKTNTEMPRNGWKAQCAFRGVTGMLENASTKALQAAKGAVPNNMVPALVEIGEGGKGRRGGTRGLLEWKKAREERGGEGSGGESDEG